MRTYLRLLKFAAAYKGRLAGALICTLLGAAFNSLSIGMLKPAYDVLLANNQQPAGQYFAGLPGVLRPLVPSSWMASSLPIAQLALIWVPFVLIFIILAKGLFNYTAEILNNQVSNKVALAVRARLFAHLQDLPLSFHSQQKGGQLISNFTNDVGLMPSGIFDVFSKVAGSTANIVGLTALIFWVNWRLALWAVVIFPLAVGPLVRFGKKIRRHSSEGQERMAEIFSQLHETLAGIRVIKAFRLESQGQKKMESALHAHYGAVLRQIRAAALSGPVMELIAMFGLAVLFGLAGTQVLHHGMTVGDFTTFMGAIAALYPQFKNINGVNNNIQNSVAASQRIFALLDTPLGIEEKPDAVHLQPLKRALVFEKVGFHYVPSKPVLKNLDLTVRSGQMVALVGPSGAGKTTLADLVPRFHDPGAGRILLDGRDIRDASLASLRDQIATVSQETFLFNDTIGANIAAGRPGAIQAEVERAAKAAHAHEFILAQPQGYQTLIGDRGVRLSGGQRQRLAIARAILKDPPLLILDEATSALDAESERLVQDAMDRLMKRRTTLVIAHRFSTVRHADRIAVLDKGQVVESGRHAELIKKKGLYSRLYRLQFQDRARA
jgi:subfamily B ATP-binding cassette protein MsbA